MLRRLFNSLDEWADRRCGGAHIVLKLFILALILRVAFVCLHAEVNLISDMLGYHESGMSLLRSGDLMVKGRLSAARPPLYPIFIYFVYYLFGAGNIFALRLVQALLGALTVIITFRLGEKAFSRKIGFWAALLLTLYPSAWGYSDMVLSETLFTILFMGGLYFLIDVPREHWRNAFFAGILLGLATLTRTAIYQLPLFLAVVWLIFYRQRGKNLVKLAVLLLSFWAVMLPWLARNERVFGQPLMTTKSGVDFFLYNHNPLSYILHNYSLEDSTVIGQVKSWALSEVEKDELARGVAMRWVKTHPLLFLFKGIRMQWNFFCVEREYVWWLMTGYWGRTPRWQIALLAPLFAPTVYLLIPLFIWGLVYAWKKFPLQRNLLWTILYFLIVTFVYSGFARNRMPLNPILMMFAGYALTQWKPILDDLRAPGLLRRPAPALALGLLAFVAIGWLLEISLEVGIVRQMSFMFPGWQQVN